MRKIKDFFWNINGNILEIYIVDISGAEYILATVSDCENISNRKADSLTAEIIEEHELIKE